MPLETGSKIPNIGSDFAPGPILTSIEELDQEGILPETVLRVPGARVIYANYDLLKHDFPQLQDEAYYKIDEWLLRNTAFISQSQASQMDVNTQIVTGNEKVKAFRPPNYGRALVFSVEENNKGLLPGEDRETAKYENRLIDVKGIGVAPNKLPGNGPLSNGICSLGDSLIELVFNQLLQKIFKHSKTDIQTLPFYGIIDPGFDIKNGWMPDHPAAIIVRRAHRRASHSGDVFPSGSNGAQLQLEIEQLLRKYGITSATYANNMTLRKENGELHIYYDDLSYDDLYNDEQKKELKKLSNFQEDMQELGFDGINIQHTREFGLNPIQATLLDFESFECHKIFEQPVIKRVSDKLFRWGGVIWPGNKDFVQPESKLQIPFYFLGETGSILGYDFGEDYRKIDSLCYGLAEDLRANRMSREMLLATLQTYLDELTGHWTD